MSRTVAILVLVIACCLLSAVGQSQDTPQPSSYALFQRAIDLQRRGRNNQARIMYAEVIKHADATVPARITAIAHANLAAIILGESSGDDAMDLFAVEKHLKAAADLDPSNEEFKRNLQYFQDHTTGQSRGGPAEGTDFAAYVRSITRKPTYSGSTRLRQIVYINLDRSTDRRATMERNLLRAPPSPPLYRLAAIDGEDLGVASSNSASVTDFVETWMSRVPFVGKSTGNATRSEALVAVHRSEMEASEPNTLACYLSHILALTTLRDLEQDEGLYLILEDDAQLLHGWEQSLEEVLKVIPSDFDVLKLTQFCHAEGYGNGESGDMGHTFRGAKLLRPKDAFPGLAKLGPGVDDGCNLGNAAFIVRASSLRLQRMLDVLSRIPIRNMDGVYNLAMDDLRFYATVRPLARTVEARDGGQSERRRSNANQQQRQCRCMAGPKVTSDGSTVPSGSTIAGGPSGCGLSCGVAVDVDDAESASMEV